MSKLAKRTIKPVTPPAGPSVHDLEEMERALMHIRLATRVIESVPDGGSNKDAIWTLVEATNVLDELHREWLALRGVKS